MNTQTLRRLLMGIIAILAIAAVWLAIRAYQVTSSNQTTSTSGPIVRNAYYPKMAPTGKIHYYNGDTFVSLDPATEKLSPLTSLRGITDITSLYWTKDGVVFSVGSAAGWHPVWKMYSDYVSKRDGDGDPNSFADDSVLNNFHWYLSFKSNTISLLSVGVDNALLYATPTSEGGLLFREYPNYSFLMPDGTVKRAIALLPEEDKERRVLKADANEYTYVAEKDGGIGLFKHSFADNKDTELVSKMYSAENHSIYSDIAMSGDDVYYVDQSGTSSSATVKKFNIKTRRTSEVVGTLNGSLVVSESGIITAVHNGSEYTKLYAVTDMNKTLAIKKPLATPKTFLSGQANYYTNEWGHLYKVGGTPVTPKAGVALEKKIFGDNDFLLSRNIESSNDNSYTVTFISGTIQDRMNQVYKAVADAGYDPLEFSFVANPGMAVNY